MSSLLKRSEAPERRAQREERFDALAEVPAGGASAEVEEFASAYDTDAPVDGEGWSLAAGGTPLPPRVAGHVSREEPGTRWVRFRVRATGAAAAAAANGARVEIRWSPAAADRRLLGGSPSRGAEDVRVLSAGEIRHGWTAVYEVRFAPQEVRSPAGRLATLQVISAPPGPEAVRELALTTADFAPTWRDAPPARRLVCLAAAFAERRLLDGGGDLADLLAAARSLAAETGDRRAGQLVVRMLAAQRPSPASPP
jgi:hypothetical protein